MTIDNNNAGLKQSSFNSSKSAAFSRYRVIVSISGINTSGI